MPSLVSRISRFARSPQGRRMTDQAKAYASRPENRRKVEQARQQLMKRR